MSASRMVLTEEERGVFQCALAARDGRRCFYCRRNFKKRSQRRKTLDHYIPHRIWPGWELDNLVLACERCNLAKDDLLPWPLVWLLLAVYRPENWELTA
ncbi:HNH endonuclease [Streptomyces phaeoluteigriseus]|uniref:HNH endonuclease n=1 Tax=Streptomyces phaeoluteigriseus TaxID=114686 RepID=UPI0036C5FFE5